MSFLHRYPISALTSNLVFLGELIVICFQCFLGDVISLGSSDMFEADGVLGMLVNSKTHILCLSSPSA